MPHPEQPNPLQQANAKAYREEEHERFERFVGFKEGAPLIFGPPKVSKNQFPLEEWQRLTANKGNKDLWDRILLTWSNKARKIFNTTGHFMRERGKIVGNSRESRRMLIEDNTELRDAFYRMFALVGQSLKTIQSQPGVTEEPGRPRAEREILDTSEALMLKQFADSLEALDPNEILRMLDEDSRFLTMLYEQQAQAGLGIAETKPTDTGGEYRLIDLDVKIGPDGKPIMRPNGEPLKINKLNPDNSDYIGNLKDLRDFILGKAEGGGEREKSSNRRSAEALIWMGIVRNMDWKQKKDLTDTFSTPREAEDFLLGSILSGVMTKQDVLDMYKDPKFSAKFDADFTKRLDKAVQDRTEAKANIAEMVENVQKPAISSFVTNLFEIPTFVKSRGLDLGAIIMVFSLVLNSTEKLGARHDKGWKSAIKAIGEGIVDTAKDRNFYIGAGLFGIGLDAVLSRGPGQSWVKEKILAASGQQREIAERYREAWRLRDELLGHGALGTHGLADWFLSHYDMLYITAQEHEQHGKQFELSHDDVKISDDVATAMGYVNGKAAAGAVQRLFKICTKDLKEERLTDSKKVAKYFKENVFSEQPVVSIEKEKQKNKT